MNSFRYTKQKQKEKFKTNPKCTLIKTTTSEMGRIIKIIVDEINKNTVSIRLRRFICEKIQLDIKDFD